MCDFAVQIRAYPSISQVRPSVFAMVDKRLNPRDDEAMARSIHVVLVLIVSLCALRIAAAADVMLVQDGKSDYIIYTQADASPAEQLGADEIAKYIKQMSGADLKIQHGGEAPAKSIAVFRTRAMASITTGH